MPGQLRPHLYGPDGVTIASIPPRTSLESLVELSAAQGLRNDEVFIDLPDSAPNGNPEPSNTYPESLYLGRSFDERVELRPAYRSVTLADGSPVHLKWTQFEILFALAKSANRAVSNKQMSQLVWGSDVYASSSRRIGLDIFHIRKQLPDPTIVQTIRNVGYMGVCTFQRAGLHTPIRATDGALLLGDPDLPITVDIASRRVLAGGEILFEGGKYYSLMQLLALNAGKIVSRSLIASTVWPEGVANPTINSAVSRIRTKLPQRYYPGIIAKHKVGFSLAIPRMSPSIS